MYSLAAMGGLVYAGTLGHIFAVDGLNEVPRWRVAYTALAPISSEGVIHIENVVQSADGFVDGVSAIYAEIGEILWTFHTDIRLGRPAKVANGVVYVVRFSHGNLPPQRARSLSDKQHGNLPPQRARLHRLLLVRHDRHWISLTDSNYSIKPQETKTFKYTRQVTTQMSRVSLLEQR